jgi:hypothetical protein
MLSIETQVKFNRTCFCYFIHRNCFPNDSLNFMFQLRTQFISTTITFKADCFFDINLLIFLIQAKQMKTKKSRSYQNAIKKMSSFFLLFL